MSAVLIKTVKFQRGAVVATLVKETSFNAYIALVRKTHRVYENLSIHHGEHDTAYQITLNNELVTVGRLDNLAALLQSYGVKKFETQMR